MERDRVWRAMLRLPGRQRAVLVLRFFDDASEARVADILGVPLGRSSRLQLVAWRGCGDFLERTTMGTELEQRLRDSLGDAAGRFVAPPDLRDRIDARVASHGRRRQILRVAGVAAVILTALGLARSVGGGEDQHVAVVAGQPGPAATWKTVTDPALGWRFAVPARWSLQHFSERCRVAASGSVVTNLDEPLRFEARRTGCTTAWDLAGVPAGFVAVQISHFTGGPASFASGGPDTALPLSLDRASAVPAPGPDEAPQPPGWYLPVVVGGDGRYAVRVWIGLGATAEDRRAAEGIVASIQPLVRSDGGLPPEPGRCPTGLTEPTTVSGQLCVPEAPAGNGLGPDGACTGEELSPPCGPGAEPDRYYPYTLALRCDGLAMFDGRRWNSGLPPPTDGGTMRVWMRLNSSGGVGFVSPKGSVGFQPDDGEPARPCRG